MLRFDFSAGDFSTIEQLDELIDVTLQNYEKQYGVTPPLKGVNIRIANLLHTLHEQAVEIVPYHKVMYNQIWEATSLIIVCSQQYRTIAEAALQGNPALFAIRHHPIPTLYVD